MMVSLLAATLVVSMVELLAEWRVKMTVGMKAWWLALSLAVMTADKSDVKTVGRTAALLGMR